MNVRAVFHDEDDARAVVARLTHEGFGATAARERFAGEDDDEDHPWAVLTDAPQAMLELLVEEYDGWLDVADPAAVDPVDGPAARPGVPLELPDAPQRVKGHFTGEGSRPARPPG